MSSKDPKVKIDVDWGLIILFTCPELVVGFLFLYFAWYYWWICLIISAICLTCYFVINKKIKQSMPVYRTADEIILDCKNYVPNVENLEWESYTKSLDGLALQTDNGDDSYNKITFDSSSFFHKHTVYYEYINSFQISKYDSEPYKGRVCIEVNFKWPWEYFEKTETILFAKEHHENAIKLYKILQKISVLKVAYLQKKKMQREERAQRESLKLTETLNSLKSFAIEKKKTEIKRNKIEDFPHIKIYNVTADFKKSEILSYVVLQIKTTDESVSHNGKITEIAALKYVEGMPYEKFIANISDEKQEDTFTIDEVRQPLLDFIGKCNLISFDIVFCLKFLFHYGFDGLIGKKRKYFSVKSYLDLSGEENYDLYLASDSNWIFYDKNSLICSCYAIDKLLDSAVKDKINEIEDKEHEKMMRDL